MTCSSKGKAASAISTGTPFGAAAGSTRLRRANPAVSAIPLIPGAEQRQNAVVLVPVSGQQRQINIPGKAGLAPAAIPPITRNRQFQLSRKPWMRGAASSRGFIRPIGGYRPDCPAALILLNHICCSTNP